MSPLTPRRPAPPRPVGRWFFDRPVLAVAEALIGCHLVRRGPGRALRVARIVETEAYGGVGVDPSAHSYKGPTPRCESMFGPPGTAYVYATQGACHCLNVSVEGDDSGRAVLLRAAEPVEGVELMRLRRLDRLSEGPTKKRLAAGHEDELAQGPGRLCICLDVDRRLDAMDLTDWGSSLYVASGEPEPRVLWTRRIGLNDGSASYAWRWRALHPESPAVSRASRAEVGEPVPGPDPAVPPG